MIACFKKAVLFSTSATESRDIKKQSIADDRKNQQL